jgi:carbonic anhydrase
MRVSRLLLYPMAAVAAAASLAFFPGASRAADKPKAEAHGAPAAGHAPHWEYKGEAGAENWGKLAEEFATCRTGAKQSPINIISSATATQPRLDFRYQPSSLRIVNNGHTIQVNYDPGSTLVIDSQVYQLLQFHFHTPSEHMLQGKAYDMEAHFVHRNAEGKLAVVGVMLKAGADNGFVNTLWANMPKAAGPEKVVDGVTIDAQVLLPERRTYFLYSGSLTTPPCSEEVRWQVFQDPIEVSAGQVAAFKQLFPMNARPVQPLKSRAVTAVSAR